MRRHLRYVFVAIALTTAACADNQLAPGSASDAADRATTLNLPQHSLISPPTQCPTVAESQKTVDSLLPQLFGPGQGRRGKAQGYSNNIEQARRNGDFTLEQAYVDSLINYTLQNYYDGTLIGGQTETVQNRVLAFIYALYCASSIQPIPDLGYIFDGNTKFIRNSTPTTIVSADSAAVEVEQGEVPTTVFGTYVTVIKTTNPLPTSLDWYGGDGYKLGAYEFISNPPVEFTSPVLTGICIRFDDAVVSSNDLRVAHAVPAGSSPTVPGNVVLTTAGGTIEIAAYANPEPLGLACDPLPPPTATTFIGKMLNQFAALFGATPAWAGASGGSTGGTVRGFSPFGAVDIKLNQSSSGPSSPQYIPVGSTSTTAPVSVTVTTRFGNTPVDGIGVSYDPAGSFAPSAATTDLSGVAASTWTLVEGANTGSAGSTLAPLTFVPATANFSVTAIQLTPLSVTTTSLPDGQQTVAYGPVSLAASGGAGAYSWALAPGSSLPGGLSLSSGGVLSGTPTVNGSFSFTVRVSSGPLTADGALSITILATPVVITTASPLPAAFAGTAYSRTLAATGGDGSYAWSLVGGALPAGLSLSSGGVVSGTPTAAGNSNFTVQASSAGGTVSATKAFDLAVTYPTALNVVFEQVPGAKQCNAVDQVIVPTVTVKVTSTTGQPIAGVRLDLIAYNNNGTPVQVSQPFAITGADGRAVFNTLSINKTGAYRLVVSTSAPWPVVSAQSSKFNVSPSC